MDLWKYYFSKNGKVTWRTLGTDCILLHLKSGIYYTLNEGGRLFWESLDGKRKLAEIQEIITHQYEVDAETLKKDLVELIQDMMREDLVEFDESPRIDSSVL